MRDKVVMPERWPSGKDIADRFTFVPLTDKEGFGLEVAEVTDATWGEQLHRAALASGSDLTRTRTDAMLWESGSIVRVTTRSSRYAVLLCASTHYPTEGESRIEVFWVHPDYLLTKEPLRLLQLARLEMPEYPTVLECDKGDEPLHQYLRDAGWTEYRDDHCRPARTQFRIASAARLAYSRACESRRTARPPATGRGQG